MTSYYIIRPVRDQLSGAVGAAGLPAFYAITFVVMLLLTPVFGWVVSRFPRRRVLIVSYVFFVVCLVAFIPAFLIQDQIGAKALGRVFFVWVSVFNLFVVSLFWSFMADIYDSAQARRLFSLIALGGMGGALCGPALTSALVGLVGVAPLLVVSAVVLLIALGLLLVLARRDAESGVHAKEQEPIGGSLLEGVKAAWSQPFLRNMAFLMLLSDGIATMAYALVADYAKAHYLDNAARTAFYAHLDLAINLLGALLQVTLTPLILRRFGAGWGLVVPSVVNFVLLALVAIFGTPDIQMFGVAISLLTIVQIGTRGLAYGMTKPASDALYTRMPREARYKGKNFIETTVWRFGDLLVTTSIQALRGVGVTIAGLGLICAALSGLATVVARRAARAPDLLPEERG
ncbi:AAA family ATP:ADP antiporter [Luteibacter rhizovicinus]|uniref:AAA family ATP:ADP antiporter n=2 Tax=Luteibacter rhizovicinus TaxID=242606 RepID=A0A4R3YRW3_9GAMM|nr:AAA family ATP:ADP antiporter [Luteibacter rhizovicinus]